jgi:hypothetical protein
MDQIPVGARFSAPVQIGFEAHPASYTMGTESFPVVKRPGRGVDNPPPSRAHYGAYFQDYHDIYFTEVLLHVLKHKQFASPLKSPQLDFV